MGKKCKSDSPNHMTDEITRREEKKGNKKKIMYGGATSLEYRGLKCLEGRQFIVVAFDLST